jgi:tRNAThr (cytosine32-N3)-methyltransferase
MDAMESASTDAMDGPSSQDSGDSRFQTDNSMSRKPQPKQQLSKAMEHMRFAVTVDPIPHTSTSTPPPEASDAASPPTQQGPENDAYGVPASLQPVRAPPSRSHDPGNNQKRSDPFAFGSRYLEEGDNIFEFNAWDHVTVDSNYLAFSEEQYSKPSPSLIANVTTTSPRSGGTNFTRTTRQTSSRIANGWRRNFQY